MLACVFVWGERGTVRYSNETQGMTERERDPGDRPNADDVRKGRRSEGWREGGG